MNKTISINLGGRNFFIEEDAYQKLEQYLSAIKAHFAQYPGSSEIVADMENRIAEKFLEQHHSNPQSVITVSDVEKLILELGTIEDITGQENNEDKKSSGSSSFAPKRLMRDNDNKIIAGVCSGLAAYFDIDPIWIRLGFILLLFAWGTIIPIYLILWLVMPEAKTPTEKMQMRGEPLNLDSLGETIKERAEEFKQHVKKNQGKEFFNEIISSTGQVIGVILRIVVKIVSLFLVIAFAFGIAILTTAFVSLLFNVNSPYAGFPFTLIAHGPGYYALLVIAYALVMVPLMFLLLLFVSLFNKRKVFSSAVGFSLFGVWLIALIFAGALGSRYVPGYVQQVKNSPELQSKNLEVTDFRDFKKVDVANSIDYTLVEGQDFKVRAEGWAMDLEKLEISKEGDVLKISRKNQGFCFFCISGDTTVEISAPVFEEITARNSSNVQSVSLSASTTTINLHNSSSAGFTFKGTTLNANLRNSSFLKVAGQAENLNVQLTNSSSIDSHALQAKNADITTGNSSHAKVWVSDLLKYKIYNSSRINYQGDPLLEGDEGRMPTKGDSLDFYDDIPPISPEPQMQ